MLASHDCLRTSELYPAEISHCFFLSLLSTHIVHELRKMPRASRSMRMLSPPGLTSHPCVKPALIVSRVAKRSVSDPSLCKVTFPETWPRNGADPEIAPLKVASLVLQEMV